jgi:hypothetical protein
LLIKFVTSSTTVNLIGVYESNAIVKFLRDYVFTHEDNFASYHYRNTRGFEEYSNTPLEGTNRGLKYSDFGVNKKMGVDKSAVNMIQQDEDKLQTKMVALHSELHKRRCCDLKSDSGKNITKKAYGQLTLQMKNIQCYASIRIDSTTWLVLRSTDQLLGREHFKIPIFQRVRQVTLCPNNVLCCDCGYIDRWGIPCRHMAHVIEFYSDKKCDFTHHDIDVRWWTIYAQLVGINDDRKLSADARLLRSKLLEICENTSREYPIVHVRKFEGHHYVYGSSSIDKFINISVAEAKQMFTEFKSKILNYSIIVKCHTSVENHVAGLNETIFLGGNHDENDYCIDSLEPTLDNDTGTSDNCNNVDGFDLSEQLSIEIGNKGKTKRLQPYERFLPLAKELCLLAKGQWSLSL